MKFRDSVFLGSARQRRDTVHSVPAPAKYINKTKTVAATVGDWWTVHSLGGVDVSFCLADESVMQHRRVLDTEAFDIVIGTKILRKNPQVKMLSLQPPYALHCNFGSGLLSVPFGAGRTKRVRAALRGTDKISDRELPVGPTPPLKIERRPCRYRWMTSRWNCSRANISTSCSCFARSI